jgi:hypothetical protein
VRPTLPPEWTLTFTYTPEPPTATFTRTPTPSITPTFSPERICEGFQIYVPPQDGVRVPLTNKVSMALGTDAPSVEIDLELRHRENGNDQVIKMPGGLIVGLEIPAKTLDGVGTYDWTLSLSNAQYSRLCAMHGTFVLYNPEATVEPTSEVTPEVTPEQTAEATPETTPSS